VVLTILGEELQLLLLVLKVSTAQQELEAQSNTLVPKVLMLQQLLTLDYKMLKDVLLALLLSIVLNLV
jgi:hypothetical protein